LKEFINYIIDSPEIYYIPAANEGDAIAIAAGVYLGGQYPVVMLQNSGLGNAVNPITSLLQTFEIPVLIVVTLRGDPSASPDEPQHRLMGKITTDLLDLMEVPWSFFPTENSEIKNTLETVTSSIMGQGISYALVMKEDSVNPYQMNPHSDQALKQEQTGYESPSTHPDPKREKVLRTIVDNTGRGDLIIATTGYTSRELYSIADRPNHFYMVGSMGCAVSIGLGLAKTKPTARVIVIDGDGALLMRLGAITSLCHERPKNLIHILLDNGEYESTGSQKTVSKTIDFSQFATASGYSHVAKHISLLDLGKHLSSQVNKLSFIHMPTESGISNNLLRPKIAPPQVASRFKRHIQELD
jgi:phosphonopyruvate decarboxylase